MKSTGCGARFLGQILTVPSCLCVLGQLTIMGLSLLTYEMGQAKAMVCACSSSYLED
jgi:hypothetical protein